MIKKGVSTIMLLLFLAVCANQAKADNIGLVISNSNQKAIVWANDEPILVIPADVGGTLSVELASQKGDNIFWITTQGVSDSTEYFTEFEVLEGSWTEPDSIHPLLKWKSRKAKDKSPVFSYFSETEYRMDTASLEDLDITDDEIKAAITEMMSRVERGLNNRSLDSCGVSKARMDQFAKFAFNVDNYEEQVFHSDTYEVSKYCSVNDLEFIRGEKTILAYSPSGQILFKAGPKQKSDGKMRYSFFLQALSIGKRNGNWILVY